MPSPQPSPVLLSATGGATREAPLPEILQTRKVFSVALDVACVVVVAYFVVHVVRAAAFGFPLDYGEGPVLEEARRLARGENIYRPDLSDYPFTISNYPPVYPALLAAVGSVFGLTFSMARTVGLLASLACALFIHSIVREVTSDARAGRVAGALFLASPYLLYWATLCRIDIVALAFSLSAVWLVTRWGTARRAPLAAAGLLTLAILTRQSHLLAGPLAVGGAFLAQGIKRGATFLASLAALLGGAVVALILLTHGGFLFHVVEANQNAFSFSLLANFWADLAYTSLPLAVLAVLRARAGVSSTRATSVLLVLYLVGTALSALTIGKVGSHVNYLLEVVASLSIFGGIALARSEKADPRGWHFFLVPGLLAAQVGWLGSFALTRTEITDGKYALRGQFEELQAIVRDEPLPVLADETMGVLVLGGHPILLQPFELTQLARQHLWDETRVLEDIRSGRFGLILVNDGPATPPAWTQERWTPEMLKTIHEVYEPTASLALATLYRPKQR